MILSTWQNGRITKGVTSCLALHTVALGWVALTHSSSTYGGIIRCLSCFEFICILQPPPRSPPTALSTHKRKAQQAQQSQVLTPTHLPFQ